MYGDTFNLLNFAHHLTQDMHGETFTLLNIAHHLPQDMYDEIFTLLNILTTPCFIIMLFATSWMLTYSALHPSLYLATISTYILFFLFLQNFYSITCYQYNFLCLPFWYIPNCRLVKLLFKDSPTAYCSHTLYSNFFHITSTFDSETTLLNAKIIWNPTQTSVVVNAYSDNQCHKSSAITYALTS